MTRTRHRVIEIRDIVYFMKNPTRKRIPTEKLMLAYGSRRSNVEMRFRIACLFKHEK